MSDKPIRAISLLSGGLDSQLAICVLRTQNIDVHALTFKSPFFGATKAENAARNLKVPLLIEDFTDTIMSLVKHPKHGYGSEMNPCIDCHTAMIRRAGQIMQERGFQFVSTGEVLNQRPMSQNRMALQLVATESGVGEFLLRPLSARLLPETEPERRRWVDRSQLLALEGRNRKPQMALAREFGLTDYPQPAGGCLLTDPGYSRRLKELMDHEGLDDLRQVSRLRLGRHFRLGAARLIVGRHQEDNEMLEAAALPTDLILHPVNYTGATGVLSANATEQEIAQAAAICARYSDCPPGAAATIEIKSVAGARQLQTPPALPDNIEPFRI